MLTEWSFLGFLVPPLTVPILVALAAYLLARRIFVRMGFYHWFSQPVLVDIALYALLLWAVLTLTGSLPIAG
ncbi:DUF1656 domain-containing protein [Halomonas getboli]|uniref:DUF1656 domain-containing protein n=1 Tax=Halomonas getboli TaxID=2935862 RepID=UPI001FFE7ED8|nr:DUF1656 domain-containing protein [Halomonas getboli]MCK2184998.1 DUF1656 domain-containing protein [Halomonas getboli]